MPYLHVRLSVNSLHAGKFFMIFCRLPFFFQNELFQKHISGVSSECKIVWIQIWPDVCPNCLQI